MKNIKTILCSTVAGAMVLCCNLSYCQPVPANHEMNSNILGTLWTFEEMMATHLNLQKDSAFFLLKGEVKSIEQDNNLAENLPYSRNFNENENCCSVTFDTGGNITKYNDFNYVYEGGKILYRVSNGQNVKIKYVYEYNTSGKISVMKYFCPADTEKGCMYKIYYTYDDRGNMTGRRTVTLNRKGKETMMSDVLFKYYENGMPAEKKILIHDANYCVHGAGGIDAEGSFIYDEKGRLTEEKNIYPTREGVINLNYMHNFTYNDKGDLATMEDKEPIHIQDNYINRSHIYNYEYDKNGDKINCKDMVNGTYDKDPEHPKKPSQVTFTSNTVSKYNYTRDTAGNLISYSSTDSLGNMYYVEYEYDSHGNWITKTEYRGGMPRRITKRKIEYYR